MASSVWWYFIGNVIALLDTVSTYLIHEDLTYFAVPIGIRRSAKKIYSDLIPSFVSSLDDAIV